MHHSDGVVWVRSDFTHSCVHTHGALQRAAWMFLLIGTCQMVSFVKVLGGSTVVAGSGKWSQEGAGGRAHVVCPTLVRTHSGDVPALL